jgi:hypothetical protein
MGPAGRLPGEGWEGCCGACPEGPAPCLRLMGVHRDQFRCETTRARALWQAPRPIPALPLGACLRARTRVVCSDRHKTLKCELLLKSFRYSIRKSLPDR